MDIVLIPMHPLERAALKNVHHALGIQTIKQIIYLFREMYRET
jgi:hypothetical protein